MQEISFDTRGERVARRSVLVSEGVSAKPSYDALFVRVIRSEHLATPERAGRPVQTWAVVNLYIRVVS